MKTNPIITTIFILFGLLLLQSCKNDTLPKPYGYLRLDYPVAEYIGYDSPCPFNFDFNKDAKIKAKSDCGIEIHYPKMKATVYLTYRQVGNNIEGLLKDAQKVTYQHVIKADDIVETPFMNLKDNVYGMFYQVGGNAATNTQFYLTDSTHHFLTGSVYFYSKPNFDSIMPAASYIKDDVQTLMESLRWK
jgi:gliding motility-associated lipoprotein GldD